jgi:hypothetical protein
MADASKSQKVNIREYIDQQVAARLDEAALAARMRESVEAMVLEVLAGQDAGGRAPAPAVIDIGIIRDVVRDELEAAGGGGGGSGGPGVGQNELRKLVAEMIEAAMGDELDGTRVAGGNPEAVRALVREELAARGAGVDMEAVAALVQNEVAGHAASGGGTGLDADAVKAIVQNELLGVPLGGGGDGGGLDEAAVRTIVAETLKAEAGALLGKVRENVGKLIAQAQQAFLDGPELAEKLARAAPAGGGGGLDDVQVKELVAQGFIERLPAGGFDAFLTRDEVMALVAERLGAAGGAPTEGGGGDPGAGGGGGLSAREVKALVKEIVNAEAPSHADVRAIVAAELRAAGGGGGNGGGLDADAVRALVREAVGELGPAPGNGGGLDADAVRALVAEAVAEAAPAPGGGDGVGVDEAAVRAIVREAVANLAPVGGGGGGVPSGINVEQFLNSGAMKEALEDRFRLMQTYIKTDLVPKLVQKALEEKR